MDPSMLPTDALDILNHPVELVIVGVLTVVSTLWSIQGLRRKDIPLFILGVAAGIPTFSIESWQAWLVAGIAVAFALWLRNKIEKV